MNAIQHFDFEGASVRTHMKGDEPWFVLSDVCRVLDIAQTASASRRLDEDERGVLTMHTPSGEQDMTVVNESGLYSLILTSRKAAAKRFKKWVTSEVLPTLRRTGVYIMSPEDEDLPALADGKVFGLKVSKVNAAARLISVANAIYGPEAARALWESEKGLPNISAKAISALTGTAEDDPVGCLHHLLRAAAGNGRSLGERLSMALTDPAEGRKVRDCGILVGPAGATGFIAIANTHPFLARHFADTQWIGDWRVALAQLPGAAPSRTNLAFGPVKSKAVMIPRAELLKLTNKIN
jgi:prophage antirepressor-like protein